VFCHKCGSKTSESADFCHKCGTKVLQLTEDTEQKVYVEPIQNQASDITALTSAPVVTEESGVAGNVQQVPSSNTSTPAVVGGILRKVTKYGRVLAFVSAILLLLNMLLNLPINPIIFGVGMAVGSILSVLNSKRPLRISKIIELAAVVLFLVVVIVVNWSGSIDYIATVGGHVPFTPQGFSTTYATVLNRYISSPEWSVRSSGDSSFVDISGTLSGSGETIHIAIEVSPNENDPDRVSIRPQSVIFDGEESPTQNDAVEFLIFMFDAYDRGLEYLPFDEWVLVTDDIDDFSLDQTPDGIDNFSLDLDDSHDDALSDQQVTEIDTTGWVAVHNDALRIPSTWIYEDIGLRGAFEVFSEDGTIRMQVEWLSEDVYEYLLESGTGQEFLFDDGNIGVMVETEGQVYWINQDRYILLWDISRLTTNEDIIIAVAKTLTSPQGNIDNNAGNASPDIQIENEIERIREVWVLVQELISENYFASWNPSDGVTVYHDDQPWLITVERNVDGLGMSRTYLFEPNYSGDLLFAIFEGSETHRLYFQNNRLFRWRHTPDSRDQSVFIDHDHASGWQEYDSWESLALNEARRFFPN